ncbi:MAG: hypothetical protein CM1200mP30_29630 [Pseudomonadota bacterium]|nr:MAG: hypothetical protein CM1200mP30_29630 [Pseudomonadota bacterium]
MSKLRGRSIAYSASPELSREFPESTTGAVPPFRYPANFRSNSIRLTWEQVGLRYACFKDKLDLLYSPIAEGILFPRLPQIITIHDLLPFHYPSLLPRWVPYYEYFLLLSLRDVLPSSVSLNLHDRKSFIAIRAFLMKN